MRGFALLRETARRGVKVRLMVDALFNSIPTHLGAYLVREGVEIRVFHPFDPLKPFRFNRRLHDKLFIADGNLLITGGRNIDNSYFGLSRFRKEGDTVFRNRIDRDILVEGETAAQANVHFMTLWNGPKVKPMHVGKYRCLIRPDDSPKRLTASRRRAIPPVHRAILQRDIDKAKAALDRAWAEFQSKPRVVQLPSRTDWNQRLQPVDKIRFFADPKGRKTRGQHTGFHIAELGEQRRAWRDDLDRVAVPHPDEKGPGGPGRCPPARGPGDCVHQLPPLNRQPPSAGCLPEKKGRPHRPWAGDL